jgi:hypothetical protein
MSKSSSQKPESSRSLDDAAVQSKLNAPRDRFLAAVVDNALSVGRRSAKDFLRHFPPRDIMNALAEQPRLRAKILVSTTGVNEKIALRKPASSAGEDLEIALSERVTEEADIVSLFDPDDRVRYLEHAKLWDFVIEGEFWRPNEATTGFIPREHIAYILSRARAEKLISDGEIVDGIGLDVLVGSLPKPDIVRVLERAIYEGRAGRVFKDERVLDVLSPQLLVEHVSLAHLWERLIGEKLAFVRPVVGLTPPARIETQVVAEEREATHAPTTPPPSAPSATALSVTSEMPVALADLSESAPSDPIAAGHASEIPSSISLNIEEGEPIIIDEAREDDLGIEVDAMLSKVGDPSEQEETEPRRSGRPSGPPPPLPREATRAARD